MGMPTVIAAEEGCPFCQKILDGSAEQIGMSGVYHFEPLNPVTPGHRLFIPAFHYTDAVDATVAAGAVFEWVSWWIPRNNPDEDFNLLTSRGDAATQTIRHFHVHYVPRRPGDGLALPWTNQQTGGTR